MPVPPLAHNELIGVLYDWIVYFASELLTSAITTWIGPPSLQTNGRVQKVQSYLPGLHGTVLAYTEIWGTWFVGLGEDGTYIGPNGASAQIVVIVPLDLPDGSRVRHIQQIYDYVAPAEGGLEIEFFRVSNAGARTVIWSATHVADGSVVSAPLYQISPATFPFPFDELIDNGAYTYGIRIEATQSGIASNLRIRKTAITVEYPSLEDAL
jgi:hypothetical protein